MSILKLKNFKSIDNLEFTLKNLNILTGLNSSGKSSIIQSMRMLHNASLKKDIYFDDVYGGFNELLCEFFQESKEIKMELTEYGHIKVREDGFDKNMNKELQVIYVGANRVGCFFHRPAPGKILSQCVIGKMSKVYFPAGGAV